MKSLRNEWRAFQSYARAKRQAALTPEDANLKKQVSAWEEKLVGLEDRIKQHEAEALKLEDEIFKVNQPQPRKYTVTPKVKAAPQAKK